MKPRIDTMCAAGAYTRINERIVEFYSDVGGGLISLRVHDGRLRVEVYRCDETVDVIAPKAKGVTS